jgi:mannose/cellobiose epimerase-like protein (N-acyl-D-glucosamine 2-epimerase family)
VDVGRLFPAFKRISFMSDTPPVFRSRDFLLRHIQHTMDFYHPRAVDSRGGFYHYLKDDGTLYDTVTRHLVSSTRSVFNYSMAYQHFHCQEYLEGVKHGLAFLRNVHRNPATGGYAWVLRFLGSKSEIEDATNHCYGLAFVLLAYAYALRAGLAEGKEYLSETFDLMEERFWSQEYGLYADEATGDWKTLFPYRGQNANMHGCEALIAAFEATEEYRYLERALLVARNITLRQAQLAGGLVWEHYHPDWSVNWEYNRNDKTNIFRPWGYQPGHLTEWAKLLLILERHSHRLGGDTDWLATRAEALFLAGMAKAWDDQYGGIYYGFAPDDTICDSDKYFWVQAESLAAAALLGARTGKTIYWDWYDRIWSYCWKHFVDHQYGAWFRILTRDNHRYSDEKSPAGKVDYHTMGACYEVLNVL